MRCHRCYSFYIPRADSADSKLRAKTKPARLMHAYADDVNFAMIMIVVRETVTATVTGGCPPQNFKLVLPRVYSSYM